MSSLDILSTEKWTSANQKVEFQLQRNVEKLGELMPVL